MYVCHNFEIVREDKLPLQADNRAFAYGDGLFETMIAYGGKVRFFERHIARLMAGLKALRMQPPEDFSETWLRVCIAKLIERNQLRQARAVRLRWQIVRRSGGFYTPVQHHTDFFITATETAPPAITPRRRVLFSEEVHLMYSSVSRFKTCNALPYVLAGIECRERGVDDLLLLDDAGHLSEFSCANLFWVKDDTLYTPSLRSGCVGGIMREVVIERARTEGISVEEGMYLLNAMDTADYVFGTNVHGIYPVAAIGNILYSPHPRWDFLVELTE